jgi:hypothetical protein
MEKEYATKKEKFIAVFWEAVENNIPEREALKIAKLEAGYVDSMSLSNILSQIEEDLLRHANLEIKLALPKAISKLKGVLDDPEQKGATNVIAASASVLDRAGVVKKESKEVNITMPSGVAFMPPKLPVDVDNAVVNPSDVSS